MDTLAQQQIDEIKKCFSEIPQEYLDWLSKEGWGEHESGYMFYSGPAYAKDIFGTDIPKDIQNIVLVADDMAGFSIAFDSNWQLVGIDSSNWQLQTINEGLNGYIKS